MTTTPRPPEDTVAALALTESELRLLWLGTETLRDGNAHDPAAVSLDDKVTAAIAALDAREADPEAVAVRYDEARFSALYGGLPTDLATTPPTLGEIARTRANLS